ncbi:MAG: alpha-hydroxy acid oxidase [Janthinobacterium lividum]
MTSNALRRSSVYASSNLDAYKEPLPQRARLAQVQNIDDLRVLARRRLPRFAFEFVEHGAEDGVSLRRNRRAFESLGFAPRTLRDVAPRTLAGELFGRGFGAPIGIAPTGRNGFLTAGADAALARAAAAHGVPFTLSTMASTALEEIAAIAAPGTRWMQLYQTPDRAYSRTLIDRAARAGYDALMVTTDTPVSGNRELRHTRRSPSYPNAAALTAANWLDALRHPRWSLDVLWPHGLPSYPNLADYQGNARNAAASVQPSPTINWQDIHEIRERWPHTLLVKGVLSVADAHLAVAAGVDGIVLSNHGGRQLDGAISPLEVLEDVVYAVAGRCRVLIDSGFRRGADIVKALIMGADMVLVGRPVLYGVAAAGEAGAHRALGLLIEEMDRVMGLLGCTHIAELRDQRTLLIS